MSSRSQRVGAVFAVALFALFIRALGFEQVFTEEGAAFAPADATYHMRRAFYTFANFPETLLHDPLLNFPGGVNVPWPPLFDWIVGGVAKLFASDQAGFERVGAWASSVFGALTVIPIYLIAVRVATPATGIFAGFIFSMIPMSVKYGRVGNPDHHSAVAFVGALLLLLLVHLARRDLSDSKILWLVVPLVPARLAMFLIWHGNLLYMALFEATVLLLAAFTRRGPIVRAEALSALLTAVALSPIVEQVLPVPIGGAYSSISLSRLHVLAMVGTSFVAFCHLALHRKYGDSGAGLRIAVMGAASIAFVAFLIAFPPTRNGLYPAFQFLTMQDGAGLATLEQLPLFSAFGREVVHSPTKPWAWFAYLLPLAPFAFPAFIREREKRNEMFVLFGWTTVFALLAMSQRRYGNDLAPAVSVAFAIGLLGVARTLLARASQPALQSPAAGWAVAILLALVLFSPALRSYELPRIASGWAALRGEAPARATGIDRIAQNVAAFSRKVRAATPDTEGFLDQRRNPEYGVIAHANLGHVLHYYGRRATATDPMWSYIGPENWARSLAFFRTKEEGKAIALAGILKGRFVVTTSGEESETVAGRLHHRDGRRSEDSPRLEHFRLVTESTPGRPGFDLLYPKKLGDEPAATRVSYKLFEIVKGAVLEIDAEAGKRVSASVSLQTADGRSFTYAASDEADDDGHASIRVPYATGDTNPVRASGPYRVSAGFSLARVHVDEVDVLEGRSVAVSFDTGAVGAF
ncbi:MAG: glycosyltransferase family 39 protein [Myxococcota bacterium]|jgi:asparagine N-glycosylation enzyme membrane subunit Stt3|nr:glycosyltransferase family 39 protein [Myxococcota bacterium]